MPIAPIPPDVAAALPAVPALYHLHGFWDPFSAASHLLGAAAFLVLGVRLVRRGAPERARQAMLAIYAFSCVLLLFISGVYHATTGGGAARALLVRLDHAAIFILIAGTFTPIHGLLFRGVMRWAPLAFIWAAAGAGVIFKTANFQTVPESVGLTLYLVMGWLGIVGGAVLWRRHGFAFVRPLLLGGAAFSVSAMMEFCRWPVVVPGVIHPHDVFHLTVLVGFTLHFSFMWQFAAPASMTEDAPPPSRSPADAGRPLRPFGALSPAAQ
jgi:channel protein (hemolysin III family)